MLSLTRLGITVGSAARAPPIYNRSDEQRLGFEPKAWKYLGARERGDARRRNGPGGADAAGSASPRRRGRWARAPTTPPSALCQMTANAPPPGDATAACGSTELSGKGSSSSSESAVADGESPALMKWCAKVPSFPSHGHELRVSRRRATRRAISFKTCHK